jgi:hypothetical protein
MASTLPRVLYASRNTFYDETYEPEPILAETVNRAACTECDSFVFAWQDPSEKWIVAPFHQPGCPRGVEAEPGFVGLDELRDRRDRRGETH